MSFNGVFDTINTDADLDLDTDIDINFDIDVDFKNIERDRNNDIGKKTKIFNITSNVLFAQKSKTSQLSVLRSYLSSSSNI